MIYYAFAFNSDDGECRTNLKEILSLVPMTGLPYRFHDVSGLGLRRLQYRQVCSFSRRSRLVQKSQDSWSCESVRAQVSWVMSLFSYLHARSSFSSDCSYHLCSAFPLNLVVHCHGGHPWGPLPPAGVFGSLAFLPLCLMYVVVTCKSVLCLDKCTIALPVMELSLGLCLLLHVTNKFCISVGGAD